MRIFPVIFYLLFDTFILNGENISILKLFLDLLLTHFILLFIYHAFNFFAVNREGLEDAAADVPALVSHAVAERLKDLLEKFAVVAEHRLDFNKVTYS